MHYFRFDTNNQLGCNNILCFMTVIGKGINSILFWGHIFSIGTIMQNNLVKIMYVHYTYMLLWLRPLLAFFKPFKKQDGPLGTLYTHLHLHKHLHIQAQTYTHTHTKIHKQPYTSQSQFLTFQPLCLKSNWNLEFLNNF